MRFPSEEWAQAFRTALNANAEYAQAARAWEGDILLLVAPDERDPHGSGVRLDLQHGVCRAAILVPDARGVQSEFVYEGKRAEWTRLLRHEIDPVKAILDGTFRIRGNLAKAMRFTRAAKALVETAAQIPVEE
jgi:putative sterol carrier protein